VVLPSVGSQLNKGETARVSGDLTSIQGAVQQFLAMFDAIRRQCPSLQTKPWHWQPLTLESRIGDVLSGTGGSLEGALHDEGLQHVGRDRVRSDDDRPIQDLQRPRTVPGGHHRSEVLTIVVVGPTQAEALLVDASMDDGRRSRRVRSLVAGAVWCVDTLSFSRCQFNSRIKTTNESKRL